jgi:hypothetical protein
VLDRYNEVQLVDAPEYLYEKWVQKNPPGGHIGRLTLFVWWSVHRVGCARIWNAVNTVNWYKWAIICNYKAAPGLVPGNRKGQYIFDLGTPCTKCPFNWTCNVKYTSLCGKHYPPPSDPVKTVNPSSISKDKRLLPTQIMSLCVLVALSHFY